MRACWLVTDRKGAKQQARREERSGRAARQAAAREQREAAEQAAAVEHDAAQLAMAIGGLGSIEAVDGDAGRAARAAVLDGAERTAAAARAGQEEAAWVAAEAAEAADAAEAAGAAEIARLMADEEAADLEAGWAAAAAADPALQRARDEQAAGDARRRRLEGGGSPQHVVRLRKGAAGGPVGDVVWLLPGKGEEVQLDDLVMQEEREYADKRRLKLAADERAASRKQGLTWRTKSRGAVARKALAAAFEADGGECPSGDALDELCRLCRIGPVEIDEWFKEARRRRRRLALEMTAGSGTLEANALLEDMRPADGADACLFHKLGGLLDQLRHWLATLSRLPDLGATCR